MQTPFRRSSQRATFDAINVDVDDSIQFTFNVKHDHS